MLIPLFFASILLLEMVLIFAPRRNSSIIVCSDQINFSIPQSYGLILTPGFPRELKLFGLENFKRRLPIIWIWFENRQSSHGWMSIWWRWSLIHSTTFTVWTLLILDVNFWFSLITRTSHIALLLLKILRRRLFEENKHLFDIFSLCSLPIDTLESFDIN